MDGFGIPGQPTLTFLRMTTILHTGVALVAVFILCDSSSWQKGVGLGEMLHLSQPNPVRFSLPRTGIKT